MKQNALKMSAWLALGVVILLSGSRTQAADAAPATPHNHLQNGGLVLSFDDRHFDEWIAVMPLFDKYGAHATFFISGPIDQQAIRAARQLQSHGQAIGVHGVHHLEAAAYCRRSSPADYVREEIMPQIKQWKAAGISPTAFAYPNSRHTAATDEAILTVLHHLRTGCALAAGEQIAAKNDLFVPLNEISQRGCLCGFGIDGAPTREQRSYAELDAALTRAAKNKELLVLYSHGIANTGNHHRVVPEALEHIFRKARELHLTFYSFDALP